MTPEGRVVKMLRDEVAKHHGLSRKVTWSGRTGAPDWLVMINGRHCFAECKAPKGKCTTIQLLEQQRLRSIGGFNVYVVRCQEDINRMIEDLENARAH